MFPKGKTFTLEQVQIFIEDHGTVMHVFGEDDADAANAMIQGAIDALSMSFVPSPSLCSYIYILSPTPSLHSPCTTLGLARRTHKKK